MFVHYSKTKAEFIAAGLATTYNNNIVFIKGDANGNGSCIYTHGTYFANFNEFLAAVNYVKGVKVGDSQYNATAGGGYIPFASADNSTVALNVENGTITVGLAEAFVTKVNNTATNLGTKDDAANSEGSAFARIANLAQLVSDLTGGSVDSIEGQITKAIDALRTEITGDLSDTTDAKTLAAINDELNGIDKAIEDLGKNHDDLEKRVKAVEDDYLKGADKTELANRITNEAPVTMTEAAGSGDILKTYTFTQNGKAIGTINLAKELVVTGGDIVEIDGVKNLQLTIANQTAPVNIPVNELVDVYTAEENANKVQVAISNTNVISASIVAGSITSAELADGAVVTAKIAEKNVTKDKLSDAVQTSLGKADTAYQKPSTGIAKTDLAEDVQAVLNGAIMEVTTMEGEGTDGDLISVEEGTALAHIADINSIQSGKRAFAEVSNVKTYVDAQWEWEEL